MYLRVQRLEFSSNSILSDFAKEAGFSSVLEFPEEQINEGFFARICDYIYTV
jgi:hypothetical protein